MGGSITRSGQDVDVARIEHLANDNVVGSTRKKKSHRRRIVDPSGAVSVDGDRETGAVVPSVLPSQDLQLPVDPSLSSPSGNQWKSDGGPQAGSLNLPSTGAANRNQDISDTPGNDILALQHTLQGFEWGMDADFQKHQFAALQQELGSTFLAALQNHAWNQPQMNVAVPRTGTNISESTRLSPESLTRANSQPLVSACHPIT